MNAKNIIISAGVALFVVVLGFAYFGRLNVSIDEDSIIARVIERIKIFGATPGPDAFNERECRNGKCTYYYRLAFLTGTTTIGQLLLPQASTTIKNFNSFFITSGTTTGAQLALYEVGSNWATSTRGAIFGITGLEAAGGRLIGTSTATTTGAAATGLILQGSTGGAGNRYLLLDYRHGSVPFLGSGFWTLELEEF